MSDPYKDKYLKYKQKYLELKKELEQKGGILTGWLEMEISLANLGNLQRGDVFFVRPSNIAPNYRNHYIVFSGRHSNNLYFKVYNYWDYTNGIGGYDTIITLDELPLLVNYVRRDESLAGPEPEPSGMNANGIISGQYRPRTSQTVEPQVREPQVREPQVREPQVRENRTNTSSGNTSSNIISGVAGTSRTTATSGSTQSGPWWTFGLFDEISGNTSGNGSGNTSGNGSGNTSGNGSGNTSGNGFGNTSGNGFGNASSNTLDNSLVITSGNDRFYPTSGVTPPRVIPNPAPYTYFDNTSGLDDLSGLNSGF